MCCKVCNKNYSVDENGVFSMVLSLTTEKKKIIDLYDLLSVEKSKNPYARFSTYLNYGLLSKGQNYEGNQKASMNLIESICEKIDFTNKMVIDVGCGRGGNLFYINSHFEAEYLVGVDLSYENVLFCGSKGAQIDFVQADAENLPFAKKIFDIVINIESALHYPNIDKFYWEVERVLKDGGIFIYVDIIENGEYEKRKELLLNSDFYFVQECDYTKCVLEAMKAAGLDRLDDMITLFSHSKMYKDLCEKRKKYILWIMKKGK